MTLFELIVTAVLLVGLAFWALSQEPTTNKLGRVVTGVSAAVLALALLVPGL